MTAVRLSHLYIPRVAVREHRIAMAAISAVVYLAHHHLVVLLDLHTKIYQSSPVRRTGIPARINFKSLTQDNLSKMCIRDSSCSAIQHLSNWYKVGDNTGVAILEKLKHLFSSREIHLQWVPSHINIAGNDIADFLAKDGAAQHTMNSAALTYSELHSTYIINKQSTVPPAHHWYEAKRPAVVDI
ncbi:UNVERIFIED_CONTAM: hypothetical protein NCL1_41888 [Trichonephila clavipes]